MPNSIDSVWDKFFGDRSKSLYERFPGSYRAMVVETNDPLSMCRIRFKCPELHDYDLNPEDCPWAVPMFDLGGNRAGRFVSPCIGDYVWITFEKQHPYGPIWSGFANPTRRKAYTYPQISQITPLSLNSNAKPGNKPEDYDKKYLPKDGRPMAHGWQDKYGNLDIHSSVGYYPTEHNKQPPPADHDAVQGSNFVLQQNTPEVNAPDKKYMARVTKYGTILIQSDQGYHWKREDNLGEFYGNFEKDEKFETKRWKFVQRLLNEDAPNASSKNGDARRFGVRTRYGSLFEIRDTGWAQLGPIQSKSRNGEFGQATILSKERTNDFRWIKLRTKGGMLWQAYDKGFNPSTDKFINRNVMQEIGCKSEQEDKYWKDKDGRWIRTVTRYGLKIVLDDRGTDDASANKLESPRANGILIKGRRSPGVKSETTTGNPRGFYWEFNENDAANHTSWGTPMGLAVEMNDKYQYVMMAASLGKNWASKWKGLKENEFIRKPTMMASPEDSAYHLKLDHENEYLRLKTRGGKGPRARSPLNRSGVGGSELQQGIEARDGQQGSGPWVEIVDCQSRGMWFSKKEQIGIWRGKKKKKIYQWIDDRKNKIVIYNNESNGVIEIHAAGKSKLNIISDGDLNLDGKNINIRAENDIKIQSGSTKFTIGTDIKTNATINCKSVAKKPGGSRVTPLKPTSPPSTLEPDDRGKTYNGPFVECPINEVEHPI